MRLIDCDERYSEEILHIFNEVIANSTALYEYKARSLADIHNWFDKKKKHGFPILALLNDRQTLVGFASYGEFRPFPANQYTVEHSVYIHKDYRGQQLGKRLLEAICERANTAGFHTIIGAIDAENTGSIQLHKKYGFEECGIIKEAGYKFDRWLDLLFMQKIFKGR